MIGRADPARRREASSLAVRTGRNPGAPARSRRRLPLVRPRSRARRPAGHAVQWGRQRCRSESRESRTCRPSSSPSSASAPPSSCLLAVLRTLARREWHQAATPRRSSRCRCYGLRRLRPVSGLCGRGSRARRDGRQLGPAHGGHAGLDHADRRGRGRPDHALARPKVIGAAIVFLGAVGVVVAATLTASGSREPPRAT